MNIDKAIKIKALTGEEFLDADPDDIDEADRLSIEALKFIQNGRMMRHLNRYDLLPGETEE